MHRTQADLEDPSSIRDYCNWLKEVLIPDLHESGMHATAEEFEDCAEIIEHFLPPLS